MLALKAGRTVEAKEYAKEKTGTRHHDLDRHRCRAAVDLSEGPGFLMK
jgi:hypothetical protein